MKLMIITIKGYSQKTLVSDILREIIDFGFGKSKKTIKINNLKKIQSNGDLHMIDSLILEETEDKDNIYEIV